MPKQTFAFEPGGEKRLEISSKLFWKDVTISFDGNVVTVIPNQRALSRGREFQLPDGSTIKVQLVSTFAANELHIFRNGQSLPGSESDPQTKLKYAYRVIYYVAGFNILFGLISFLFHPKDLLEYGIGFNSIVFGFVFIALGWLVQQRSTIALFLAILTLLIDGFVCLYFANLQGYTRGDSGIIYRLFLLVPMLQGFSAIQALKTRNA